MASRGDGSQPPATPSAEGEERSPGAELPAVTAAEGQDAAAAGQSPPGSAPRFSPEQAALVARLDRMQELQNRSMNTIIPILGRVVESMQPAAAQDSPEQERAAADGMGNGTPHARGRVTDARPGSRRSEMFRLSSVPLDSTPARIEEPTAPPEDGPPRDVILPVGPAGFSLLMRNTAQARPAARGEEGSDVDSEYQRHHPRLGARLGDHHGRPSSAGVRAVMGYGPRSEGSMPSRQLGPAPREPEQGKSLSIKESELAMFTGEITIAKGVDKALTIEGCPIHWLTEATERLKERRIDPTRWVAAIVNRLAPAVRTRFREHFSDRAEARAWTMIPFAMAQRRTHPADSADWEDFWRWLLRTYLRPAHQDAAHRRWQALEHHRSTATSLMADTAMFNEALMHADLMEHVLRRDEGWLEAPEIEDTYERRRVYRAMLPEEIQLHVTQTEAQAARQAAIGGDAQGSWLSSTLVGEGQAHAPEFTLDELQNVAVSFALVLERDAVRAQTQRLARLNVMQVDDVVTPAANAPTSATDARLHALEAEVQGFQLDAEAGDVDQELLFNIAAQHLPAPPPPALIQQRREAGQCLACGESTSHSRFTECPQARSNPALVETLRAFLRRHNDERRARGGSRAPQGNSAAYAPPPAARPPPATRPAQEQPSRAQLSAQVHNLMEELHHLAALVQGDPESDEEAGARHDGREGSPKGKGNSRGRDVPPPGARS